MIKINELMKKVKELDYDITFLNDEETELFERYLVTIWIITYFVAILFSK